MKLISLILSLIIYSGYSNAECSKPVNYLTEGTKAPCTGYLFTPEKEAEVRDKIIKFDTLNELTKKQDEMITVLGARIITQQDMNKTLESELQSEQNKNNLYKYLAFSIGFILGYGFYGATK